MNTDKFAGHTPGPWHIQYLGSLDECEIRSWAMATNQWQPVALPIARVPHAIYRADPSQPTMHIQLAANVELMRAAPELLAENERLRADLARVSAEFGLPPSIGPAPGAITAIREGYSDCLAEIETLRNRVAELEQLATDVYLEAPAVTNWPKLGVLGDRYS